MGSLEISENDLIISDEEEKQSEQKEDIIEE